MVSVPFFTIFKKKSVPFSVTFLCLTFLCPLFSRILMYPYLKTILAQKTTKNQLTLPKEIADKFPGIDLFDASVKNNQIVLVPVKVTPITSSLESIRDKMEKLGISEDDVAGAVKWARKRRVNETGRT